MATRDKETDKCGRGKLGVRTDMTDHPSPSSVSSLQTQASPSSFSECSQSLKVMPEEKADTIPGSSIATLMALSFKLTNSR